MWALTNIYGVLLCCLPFTVHKQNHFPTFPIPNSRHFFGLASRSKMDVYSTSDINVYSTIQTLVNHHKMNSTNGEARDGNFINY